MTVWPSAEDYLHAEWNQFVGNPVLGQRTLDAVGAREVATVLDVGCGAGQEMIPFLTAKGAMGVGIDRRLPTLPIARDLLAGLGLGNDVQLACGKAEALPIRSERFDLIICRSVLPYTDNRAALAELHRVLRAKGVVIVQADNLRKSLAWLRRYLIARDWPNAKAAARRLLTGIVYQVSGRQPTSSWFGAEVAYSRRLLGRELRRAGLRIVGEIPHGNPRSFAVVATRGA